MWPRSITRSQTVLVSAHVGGLFLSFGVTTIVGRSCSPEDFGFFALVSTLFAVAKLVMDGGMGTVALREISRDPSRERPILEGVVGWRRAVGTVLGAGLLAFALTEPDDMRRTVLLGAGFCVPFLASGGLASVFHRRQEFEGPAVLVLVGSALVLMGAGVLAVIRAAGHAFAWLVVAREFLSSRVFRRMALRRLGTNIRPGITKRGLPDFLRMALVYGVSVLAWQACFHADVFLVRALRGDAELGAYAAAFRPVTPLLRIAGLLMLPVLPLLSSAWAQDRDRFRRLLVAATIALAAFGTIGAGAAWVLAEDVLRVLYGDTYAVGPLDAKVAFRWLAVALGASFCGAAATTALLAASREKTLLILGAGGLALNVAANLLLIPRHGFEAAAATTAGTEFILAVGAAATLLGAPSVAAIRRLFAALLPGGATALALAWLPGPPVLRLTIGVVVAGCAVGWVVFGTPGKQFRQATS